MLYAGLATRQTVFAETVEDLNAVFRKVGGAVLKDYGNGDYDVSVTQEQYDALEKAGAIIPIGEIV